MKRLFSFWVVLVAAVADADVCSWRDVAGHMQYGDRPPAGTTADCGSAKSAPRTGWNTPVVEDDCAAEMKACAGSEFGCVSLGVPDGSDACDTACQAAMIRKMESAKIPGNHHPWTRAPAQPRGCVGFRPDLGGTEKGAQCIADLLGIELHRSDCRDDGWPYNVRTP